MSSNFLFAYWLIGFTGTIEHGSSDLMVRGNAKFGSKWLWCTESYMLIQIVAFIIVEIENLEMNLFIR